MKTKSYIVLGILLVCLTLGIWTIVQGEVTLSDIQIWTKDVNTPLEPETANFFYKCVIKQYILPLVAKQHGGEWVANSGDLLKGLKGVIVGVRLSPKGEEFGLNKELLQTDAELRLRKYGIRVGPSFEQVLLTKDFQGCDGVVVEVLVNVMCSKEMPEGVIVVAVKLSESVFLERKPTVTSATTWEKTIFGLVGKGILKDRVRETLGEILDQFINEYLAANPTLPTSPSAGKELPPRKTMFGDDVVE